MFFRKIRSLEKYDLKKHSNKKNTAFRTPVSLEQYFVWKKTLLRKALCLEKHLVWKNTLFGRTPCLEKPLQIWCQITGVGFQNKNKHVKNSI